MFEKATPIMASQKKNSSMKTCVRNTLLFVFSLLFFNWPCAGQFTIAYSSNTQSYASSGDRFGNVVSPAGDCNGDGFDDVIIGAPRDDVNGVDSGSARVISGFDGSVLHTFLGAVPETWLGTSVSGAGDVNADGFDDVIIGSPRQAPFPGILPGIVEVFSGLDGSLLHSFIQPPPLARTNFGVRVSGAGDVNADGYDDVIVSGNTLFLQVQNQGRVYVYSGFDGSTLMTLDGFPSQIGFGASVSDAGDLNTDGFDDILVGAYQSNHAYAFSGADGSLMYTWSHPNQINGFGFSMSRAGDVNNDGCEDVIIGFPYLAQRTGLAQVFSGMDGQVIYTFIGNPNSEFGYSVDTAGDVNGDGYDDLVVGAPTNIGNGVQVGRVSVFSGIDGNLIAVFNGLHVFDYMGSTVATAGDTNGDGLDDIVVGAPGWDNNGIDTGAVWILAAGPQPVVNFETEGPWPHFLDLQWQPAGGNPTALTGIMRIESATAGGVGAVAASLQSQESTLFGFLPVLLANDAANLIIFEAVSYDSSGSLETFIDRQNPALAGTQIFVQAFESFPLVLSSNGLRFDIVP